MKRASFTIKYTVDLDAVPGWGHSVTDWIALAQAGVLRQQHYNTSAEVVEITETGEQPYVCIR
jgi:hypothetical protein